MPITQYHDTSQELSRQHFVWSFPRYLLLCMVGNIISRASLKCLSSAWQQDRRDRSRQDARSFRVKRKRVTASSEQLRGENGRVRRIPHIGDSLNHGTAT